MIPTEGELLLARAQLEVEGLRAILDRMRSQLETVRGLHLPDPTVPLCIECRKYYPCHTARAAVAGGVVVEEGML